MASLVQSKALAAGNTSSMQLTYDTNPSTGNLLVCYAWTRDEFTDGSISDNGVRVWTPQLRWDQAGSGNGGSYDYRVWTAPVGTGGAVTVTVVPVSGNFSSMAIFEVTACDVSTTPISVSITNYHGTIGTSIAVGPTGTCGPTEIALSVCALDYGATQAAQTPDGAWTKGAEATGNPITCASRAVNSQTVSITWTISSNVNGAECIFCIKNAAAADPNIFERGAALLEAPLAGGSQVPLVVR